MRFPTPFEPERLLRFVLGVFGSLVCLIGVAPAAADAPPVAEAREEARVEKSNSLPFYLFVLGFGVAASATYVGLRRRGGRGRLLTRTSAPNPGPSRGRSAPSERLAAPSPAGPEASAAARGDAPMAVMPQFLIAGEAGDRSRECPSCRRRFDETVVLCPFDAAPLRGVGARSRRRPQRHQVGSRPRSSCSTCGRCFHGGAAYCYEDGTKLSYEVPRDPAIARVCRSCGWETLGQASVCPQDGEELTVVDPSDEQIVAPALPMMVCRRCHHLDAPGVELCPHDDQPLVPLMNLRVRTLPPTGMGPRRQICPTCSSKYSTTARFCAYDGAKLTPLN